MKKRVFIYILIWILGCVCGSGAVYLKFNQASVRMEAKKGETRLVEFGDVFPIDEIYAMKEKKFEKNKMDKLYLYIDPYCDSCYSKFPIIEKIYNILDGVIQVNILWNKSPENGMDDAINIPKENQYIAKNVNILNEYPLYFITDENNIVKMVTDDESKIVKKIADEIGKEELIDRTNIFLQNMIQNQGKERQTLIYFSMEGCPDCKQADEILTEVNAKEKYDMLTIYTDESKGKEEFIDDGNLFATIYEIGWYPSFMFIKNGEYQFVGQEEKEDLISIIENGI